MTTNSFTTTSTSFPSAQFCSSPSSQTSGSSSSSSDPAIDTRIKSSATLVFGNFNLFSLCGSFLPDVALANLAGTNKKICSYRGSFLIHRLPQLTWIHDRDFPAYRRAFNPPGTKLNRGDFGFLLRCSERLQHAALLKNYKETNEAEFVSITGVLPHLTSMTCSALTPRMTKVIEINCSGLRNLVLLGNFGNVAGYQNLLRPLNHVRVSFPELTHCHSGISKLTQENLEFFARTCPNLTHLKCIEPTPQAYDTLIRRRLLPKLREVKQLRGTWNWPERAPPMCDTTLALFI